MKKRTMLFTIAYIFMMSVMGIFYNIESAQGIIGACLICFIIYFLICGSNIKTHFLGFLFGISCFSFLFGYFLLERDILSIIGINELARYCFSLSFSLLGLIIGLEIGSKKVNQNINALNGYITDDKTKKVYSIVDKFFWVTIPFSFAYALLRGYYSIRYGYVYLYNNPEVFLSGELSFITNISSLTNVAYTILLSTLPKIRKIKNHTIALLIYNILLLFSGSRTGLLRFLFLIVSYLFIMRHSYGKIIISKKKIFKYAFVSIVSLYFFSLLFTKAVNFRTNLDYYSSDTNPLVNLISSEGKTWKVVIDAFGVYDRTTIGEHLRFYFMPLINTATLQFLFGKIGLGFVQSAPYTVEYALNSFDYSHYYTYISDQALYLSGGGLGTSYLAESYFLGKNIGVIFHSILIGIFLSSFLSKVNKSLLKNMYMWVFIYNIFWSPRGSALGPFFSFFSFANLSVLVFLYLYLQISKKN